MKKLLKTLHLFDYFKGTKEVFILLIWNVKSKPVPPPHVVKKKAIKKISSKFGLKIMVETGTYYGEMIYAMRNKFQNIFSVELSPELADLAKTRFSRNQNVEIIQGDSGKVLNQIIAKLDSPAIFWLDGHYSGGVTAKGESDTPIFNELM